MFTSLLTAVVLASPTPLSAATELRITLEDGFGSSRYRVLLEMPSELLMGDDLKVVFTLYLDELPPLKHFAGYLSLTFTLLSEDGRTVARTTINNRAEPYKVDFIYPGYRWGPYSLTLKPDYSRLSAGGKVSVYITLEAEENVEDHLGVPVIPTRPNPSTVKAAELRVSQRLPIFESALLVVVFGLVLAGGYVVFRRMRRGSA